MRRVLAAMLLPIGIAGGCGAVERMTETEEGRAPPYSPTPDTGPPPSYRGQVCRSTTPFTSFEPVAALGSGGEEINSFRLNQTETRAAFGMGDRLYYAARDDRDASFDYRRALDQLHTDGGIESDVNFDSSSLFYVRTTADGRELWEAQSSGTEWYASRAFPLDASTLRDPFVVNYTVLFVQPTTNDVDADAQLVRASRVSPLEYDSPVPLKVNGEHPVVGTKSLYFVARGSSELLVSLNSDVGGPWSYEPPATLGVLPGKRAFPSWISDDECRLYFISDGSVLVAKREPPSSP